MTTAIVLFTRDLRANDHPALAAAVRQADEVVPLFVLDEGILATPYAAPNRLGFLRESLLDLDRSLAALGSRLHVRRGDVVDETLRVAREVSASVVHVSEDASGYAQRRETRLAERIELQLHPGVTAVPFDQALTNDGRAYSVFGPYDRRWSGTPLRALEHPPVRLRTPELSAGSIDLDIGSCSPEVAAGGETAGRALLDAWIDGGLELYGRDRGGTEIARERTSRLSPYLHFGCVSSLECVTRAREVRGGEPWVRELAWRDFYAQLLRAHPRTSREDLHAREYPRGGPGELFHAWRDGRTGYPIVDAGMRQLQREGWMHNRVRLIVASFLAKDLELDWRLGARHFEDLLLDGDVASNRGNWQWVVGTGVDYTQGGRMFNPTLQAKRRDASGDYVRRYVPELAHLGAKQIHEPWLHGGVDGYPAPIVDHAEVASRRRRARQSETLF